MLTEFDVNYDRWKACVDNHLMTRESVESPTWLMGEIIDELAMYEHGDFQPVVRCRDCVYCKDNSVCFRKVRRGGTHNIDKVHANFYCAAGKRRDDNHKISNL